MIDVQHFYAIARKYVGNLNQDLVHHVFEKTSGKLPADNPGAYFHQSLKNELRKDSSFWKIYGSSSAIVQDVEDVQETDPAISPEEVQEILSQLSSEGYRLEVKVFIEMSIESNALKLNKITGVRYENLLNIRTFVKKEIQKRYAQLHDNF